MSSHKKNTLDCVMNITQNLDKIEKNISKYGFIICTKASQNNLFIYQ